jgi:dihydrofolate synthase/folylpolyglutamate synthase
MKLQKIIERLQKLHPKEIDLSLDRIKNLCNKLGNPQNNLKCVQITGTNGKYITIQAIRAILKEAGINCNIYTSPHIQRINERFVYNDKEISDEELANLLSEIEKINAGNTITYFEILTAAFFYGCKKYSDNLTLCEFGLFARFDAVNILKKNLATIVTTIGLDHLDWLPENDKNIDGVIFEKTSSLLNSKIIVSKQNDKETLEKIKKSLDKNKSKKIFFNDLFSYTLGENNFFYYEDQYGGLKLPMPNLKGEFQLSNVATAIATIRNIEELKISEENIKIGITKIRSIARLQEIKTGKLKNLVKNNKLFVDGTHNPLGAKVLSNYLSNLNCNIHMILGMMNNKDHEEYVSLFKGKLDSLTTIDIPNQKNSINKDELKNKISKYGFNLCSKKTFKEAITSLKLNKNDIIIITGSLYLAGEVLNLN